MMNVDIEKQKEWAGILDRKITEQYLEIIELRKKISEIKKVMKNNIKELDKIQYNK